MSDEKEYTRQDLINFGNLLLSRKRKDRMVSNLKGSRTGTPIAQHLKVVTHADLAQFAEMQRGA